MDGTKDFIFELLDKLVFIRPKGCRRGGPMEIIVPADVIYDWFLFEIQQLEKKKAKRRRRMRPRRRARGRADRRRRTRR